MTKDEYKNYVICKSHTNDVTCFFYCTVQYAECQVDISEANLLFTVTAVAVYTPFPLCTGNLQYKVICNINITV